MTRKKLCKQDRIFNLVSYVLLTFALVAVAYPLYFVLIASVSDPIAVGNGQVWFWPKGVSFEGYKRVLGDPNITHGYTNTIVYTFVGTAINLLVTLPAAFAMSRKNLKGRGLFMTLFMITMFVSGGMIPTYLVVKKLGLLDTIGALVLPGAMSVYNMLIARTFFQTSIPESLWEASEMDGCTYARYFASVVLPLSKAIIAILALFYGIGHWNAYYNAMIYLTDSQKFPLQLVMRAILTKNQMPANMMLADVSLFSSMQYTAEMIKYA
ncbi:MAG: carbohydrate ABC transporter permease, partial [Clostridia bacterium]